MYAPFVHVPLATPSPITIVPLLLRFIIYKINYLYLTHFNFSIPCIIYQITTHTTSDTTLINGGEK